MLKTRNHFISLAILAVLISVAMGMCSMMFNTPAASAEVGSQKCTTTTIASVNVNPYTSALVLATSSNNLAFARIQLKQKPDGTASSTVSLAFNNGGAATVSSGLMLDPAVINSTNQIDFGLNTDFPYIGAVYGIAGTATTTLLITACAY